MKKLLFFFIFILALNYASAATIGISPAEINLNADMDEETCKNITLSSDSLEIFEMSDAWTKEGSESKNLVDYVNGSGDFSIEVIYEEVVGLQGKQEVKICFNGERAGNFRGVILARGTNSNSGVGSWVNLKISGDNEEDEEKK